MKRETLVLSASGSGRLSKINQPIKLHYHYVCMGVGGGWGWGVDGGAGVDGGGGISSGVSLTDPSSTSTSHIQATPAGDQLAR